MCQDRDRGCPTAARNAEQPTEHGRNLLVSKSVASPHMLIDDNPAGGANWYIGDRRSPSTWPTHHGNRHLTTPAGPARTCTVAALRPGRKLPKSWPQCRGSQPRKRSLAIDAAGGQRCEGRPDRPVAVWCVASVVTATGHAGACPYQLDDLAGHSCGRPSAYSRPGGATPLCYRADVTGGMVEEWRRWHH
jgi:hypothetical protein